MSQEITNFQRAEILTQALPYIQKYYNKVVVVKYGGNAMINEELKQHVMEDVVLLQLIGVKVVLVHGGGPEITNTMSKLGKETQFVNGLRVTDKESAEIAQMVLAGKVNKNLANLLQVKGGRAIGLSGIDGGMIYAKMKNPEIGFVGEITDVDIEPIETLLQHNYIPVVSTVGCDAEGNVYNINADTAASAIAAALSAERLFELTDIEGILRDKDDPTSRITNVSVDEARELLKDGTISGGMIPKVEGCIEAIEKGVKTVVIMDGRVPHSILIEMLTDEGAGSMIYGN